MKRWLTVVALAVTCAWALAAAPPAAAQQLTYLELASPLKAPIPANCSTWHELYPQYCMIHHQDDFQEGAPDGQISACDYIKIDNVWYHIEWVGPTYRLSFGALPGDYEPVGPVTGGNPVCETWIEVWPEFGPQFHVDQWIDNGDGVVSPCDFVVIGGATAHIDEIKLNIRVRPGEPPIDTERQSWGDLKTRY